MGRKRDLRDLGDLDVQEEEPEQKILKAAMKECPKCGTCKSLDQYSADRSRTDGLQCYCKACNRDLNKARRNTQDGFLNKLVGNARKRTVERNKKGRNHKFTLTVPKLKTLIEIQEGKCAISGAILVFKTFSDNQASVDRINDKLGYVDGNCRLVCLEFNTPVKWSRQLLLESITLSGIPPKNFEDEVSYLETGLLTGPLNGGNGMWRGALHELIRNAEKSTNRRNKCRKADAQSEGFMKCTLKYIELVAIFKAQGGMCAYSLVALSPRIGDWKVSLERKDVTNGYISSNVCLVCQRFNSIDNSALADGRVEGSGGWSRSKFLRYTALVSI